MDRFKEDMKKVTDLEKIISDNLNEKEKLLEDVQTNSKGKCQSQVIDIL